MFREIDDAYNYSTKNGKNKEDTITNLGYTLQFKDNTLNRVFSYMAGSDKIPLQKLGFLTEIKKGSEIFNHFIQKYNL